MLMIEKISAKNLPNTICLSEPATLFTLLLVGGDVCCHTEARRQVCPVCISKLWPGGQRYDIQREAVEVECFVGDDALLVLEEPSMCLLVLVPRGWRWTAFLDVPFNIPYGLAMLPLIVTKGWKCQHCPCWE